jgi:hypothetical protein
MKKKIKFIFFHIIIIIQYCYQKIKFRAKNKSKKIKLFYSKFVCGNKFSNNQLYENINF